MPRSRPNPLGRTTITTYDALNRPTLVTFPDSSTKSTAYTSTGLAASTTDERGFTTTFGYDTAGRKTTVTSPPLAGGVSAVTSTAYDAADNVVATTNPLGKTWNYTYDVRNRKITELAPPVADASNGNTVARPKAITVYDFVGNVTAVTDPRGNVTGKTYDAANRLIRVVEPDVAGGRPTINTAYDLNGNVTAVTDADGNTVNNTYDALNRLTATNDAMGITVASQYDQVGNRTAVIDGKGATTAFAYDGLNRNTAVIDTAGKVTTFVYDALNKTARVDANQQETDYTYDPRNRLASVSYVNLSVNNRTYAYDVHGNLLAVSESGKNGKADVSYTYDAINRVLTESSGTGGYAPVTHTYAYDLAGNRLTTVYGGTGRTLTSTYDALNRLNTLTEGAHVTTYGYDLSGNHVLLTLPNGDTTATTYDALNRALAAVTGNGSGTLIQSFSTGYDLVGNVTSITETYATSANNRTITNTYDKDYRLVNEAVTGANATNTAYTFDAGNNRTGKVVTVGSTVTTTAYTYNSLNQLTGYTDGVTPHTLTYDANGNRLTRTQAAGTDTYVYDDENRLVSLTQAAGTTNSYDYDYRTRRVERVEGGALTRLVFSGGTSVQEFAGGAGTQSAPAITAPTVEYVRGSDYGGGVGGILYTIRSGVDAFTHYNKRGDVTAKTDINGVVTYQAAYEAYGKRTEELGSTPDRQKANTKEEDPTGLLNEGMRYRDLDTGYLIPRDPAGFVDGPNLYA